jgi:hypothetical protein
MVLVVAMAGVALAMPSDDGLSNMWWSSYFPNAYRRSTRLERNVVVQRVLEQNGYSADVDGWFGEDTEDVVKLFQINCGFTGDDVDGYVGADTWHELQNTSVFGATWNNYKMYTLGSGTTWYMRHNPSEIDGSYWHILHYGGVLNDGNWHSIFATIG